VSGSFIRHAREGGHPGYLIPNFLDSCLRRNDGLYRRKLPDCSINSTGKNIHNQLDAESFGFAVAGLRRAEIHG
jgi:hypothetical protein